MATIPNAHDTMTGVIQRVSLELAALYEAVDMVGFPLESDVSTDALLDFADRLEWMAEKTRTEIARRRGVDL